MDRAIVHPDVESYLRTLLPSRPPVVQQMEREAEQDDFPIVGPLVGRLLHLLARSVGAERVFELGSGYGYSTYWFAEAVGAGGNVVHTDFTERNSRRARDNLSRLGLGERVRFEVGDALEILGRESGLYDVIFCDVEKAQYPDVPAIALPRLRRGGLLIFDNTLWKGRVTDSAGQSRDTAAIQALNHELYERSDVWSVIVPLRDGVAVGLRL
jgi:caffeoyl-CoA O-methyltransferase